MDTSKLQDNIAKIRERIDKAAQRSNRSVKDITLVAVTKKVTVEVIEMLVNFGIEHIGENRVQDAKSKKQAYRQRAAKWHMIGHMQRNKVKDALEIFDFFHSVDRVAVAQEIDKRALEPVSVLLEVNISGETSKHGFSPQSLQQQIESLLALPNLKIHGLMTMAPFTNDMNVCRSCFQQLRSLAEKLHNQYREYLDMSQLSMGMSQDFEVAIEEGATMVRVGSAFFQ